MIICGFFLAGLFLTMLPLIVTIPQVRAWSGSTITIQADGSVNPQSAPVQQVGNVYTLTDNIVSDSDGIVVAKNGITLNGYGHTIQGSSSGNGIDLTSTSDVIVENFTVESFSFGIFAPSVNNDTITGINITQNIANGIWFASSSNNKVYGNNIQQNGAFGIWLSSSQNNQVYHNNFVNNAAQVHTTYDSNNIWNNSYPSGGNYWSDYTGQDFHSGPGQNQPGSDGIGDTPYTIDSNNVDYYPLMNPSAQHDLAILNLTLLKTVVGQGFSTSLNVTVENFGSFQENFNVTASANGTIFTGLATNITVSSGDVSYLALSWNTTRASYGSYTISAYAWPVSGETNTANNNFTGGVVKVTILGDINGDFTVGLSDLVLLAKAYSSKPGDARWNPNADINGDGTVGLSDLVIMARHYNQSIH
jgi:parallel beta-helix repeat protein